LNLLSWNVRLARLKQSIWSK